MDVSVSGNADARLRWNKERQRQDVGEEQADARKVRQDRQVPGKAEANSKERQARQRQIQR